jgi:hypothetical protein
MLDALDVIATKNDKVLDGKKVVFVFISGKVKRVFISSKVKSVPFINYIFIAGLEFFPIHLLLCMDNLY